jgi:hypothetical protein
MVVLRPMPRSIVTSPARGAFRPGGAEADDAAAEGPLRATVGGRVSAFSLLGLRPGSAGPSSSGGVGGFPTAIGATALLGSVLTWALGAHVWSQAPVALVAAVALALPLTFSDPHLHFLFLLFGALFGIWGFGL